MSVSTKGKRKIIISDQIYYWHVENDYEVIELGTDISLIVVSDNKRFLIRYPINQNNRHRNHIIVLGKIFGGHGPWGDNWQRVESPKWETNGKITPSSVERLVRWSLSDKKNVFVTYQGQQISYSHKK